MVKNAIRMTIEGKRYVAVPEADFRRLSRLESGGGVKLPPAACDGSRPALETIDAMIANDVREARLNAGMTQVQLAEAAGLRVETISRIENGKHGPGIRTLQKIGRAMGLDWR